MAEYIEREAVLKKAQWFEFYDEDEAEEIAFKYVDIEDVEDAPTVDVVEVVRCKNCIFFDYGEYQTTCRHIGGLFEPMADGFCSYGERKPNE